MLRRRVCRSRSSLWLPRNPHGALHNPLLMLLARLARDADSNDLETLLETTACPMPGKRHARDVRGARSMRNAVCVGSLVPVGLIPDVAAVSLAATADEPSFKAVNRPAVLEPLHHAVALFHA